MRHSAQQCTCLLGVVVDGASLLHGIDNGGEVIVGQDHGGGGLGHSSAGAHRNTNIGLLQSRGVVDTITSLGQSIVGSAHSHETHHGRNLASLLQILDNLALVDRLDTSKELGVHDSLLLVGHGQRVKLGSGESLVRGVLVLSKHSNLLADGGGGVLDTIRSCIEEPSNGPCCLQ